MKSKHIYLAGPLFSRGEIRDRLTDEKKLKKAFGNNITIYSPYTYNLEVWESIDNKPSFFQRDLEEMEKADIAIIDLDNFDPGTIAELGWFYRNKTKIYAIYSNWKHQFDKSNIMNKFVEGLVQNNLYQDIEHVIYKMKGDYKWKK